MVALSLIAETPLNTRHMDINLQKGTFIKNTVKLDEAKTILAIAIIWGHLKLREAYVKLNTHNKGQRLKDRPNITFGRGKDYVWFAYCNDTGDLLTQDDPIAAIFFNS